MQTITRSQNLLHHDNPHEHVPLQAALSGVYSITDDLWPWDSINEATSAGMQVHRFKGPSGVLLGFPLERLLQLDPDAVLIYKAGYDHAFQRINLEIPPGCKGTHLFVGARQNFQGHETVSFTIAAIGSVELVQQVTRFNNTKHENGVFWYCRPGLSFGFSGDPKVRLNNADTLDDMGECRLSWLMRHDMGGGRVGINKGVNDGSFLREIYCLTPRLS